MEDKQNLWEGRRPENCLFRVFQAENTGFADRRTLVLSASYANYLAL
jgi:hypothetical protein